MRAILWVVVVAALAGCNPYPFDGRWRGLAHLYGPTIITGEMVVEIEGREIDGVMGDRGVPVTGEIEPSGRATLVITTPDGSIRMMGVLEVLSTRLVGDSEMYFAGKRVGTASLDLAYDGPARNGP